MDKRLADLTTRDVRSYFRRTLGLFLLGCLIGIVGIILFVVIVSH